MDDLEHAHDLRHRSDAARLAGRAVEALSLATEAVGIYAGQSTHRLDLANALRLKALALDDLDQPGEATLDWTEARGLYAELGIAAGVTECDARLAR
ncbi:hypothetical protein BZG35_09995 [Brevundimonas sp. LM2]|uniref:hypothetical protein n=1 Tax=Brevundimonas sp. LM2 TaxID=1938605 RepID=UPI0009840176|nr:hypothetical protein [Brevundimonas sp. LM2]AQR61944.1 hypothetical protein BZG35_09995 [Brevundimonas sp. LM2]